MGMGKEDREGMEQGYAPFGKSCLSDCQSSGVGYPCVGTNATHESRVLGSY